MSKIFILPAAVREEALDYWWGPEIRGQYPFKKFYVDLEVA